MHLQSQLDVDYSIDQVTKFFYEPSSLAKWDRSVAQMIPASTSGPAVWHFQFDPINTGTMITCHVYFKLRLPYFFLYPFLYFNKHALSRDLGFFKKALEENYPTKN